MKQTLPCASGRPFLGNPRRGGYEAAAKHFAPVDLDVNLSGRSFMITGANSGIGKATTQEIANRGECYAYPEDLRVAEGIIVDGITLKAGGTIHMVCRNKERAEAAKDEIIKQSKNEDVHVHVVDMSSAREVWEFAQNFSQNNTVHVLINNAGCMVNQRELTEEGIEKNFATNTLGKEVFLIQVPMTCGFGTYSFYFLRNIDLLAFLQTSISCKKKSSQF
ncbi:hypothetical protein PAMA_002843 [Pampus argenteus]